MISSIGIIASSLQGYDLDAANYFTRMAAAGYTLSSSEKNAVNTFITGLKSNNLYTKIYDMGLLIGGTAATHALTFKGIVPSTVWFGTVTHSANGVQGNGSTGYGDLGFAASSLPQNNVHVAIYNRTNTQQVGFEFGSVNSAGTNFFELGTNVNSASGYAALLNSASVNGTVPPSAAGFFEVNRTDANTLTKYINGSSVQTITTASLTPNTVNNYLLARNFNGANLFSTHQVCFWSVGNSMTAAEPAAFSSLVNNLQTSLNRNVF